MMQPYVAAEHELIDHVSFDYGQRHRKELEIVCPLLSD